MADRKRNVRRHGARYRARRRAVDIIYEAEIRDVDPVSIIDERVLLARDPDMSVAPISDYTRTLVAGTATMLDEIDAAIERYLSAEWELHRLPAVDRAILRVLAWEIIYNPDVDGPVSVVEAVEIASEYSTDVAAPYVNAVLDDIAKSEVGPAAQATPAVTANEDTSHAESLETQTSAGDEDNSVAIGGGEEFSTDS